MSAYIGPERQLAQFAGGPWTILWRMQNAEGQGPYCGLHPETGERLSRVMDVYTSDENRHPGPAGDLTEDLFHYWSDRYKERTQFLFGFADLQSAHEWFNEQEREGLLKDGFWLQMVAARHVIPSISGKQVAFIPHSNREWTGPKTFVPEEQPPYITTARNYLTQAVYAAQELRVLSLWAGDGKIPARAPEGPYGYYSAYSPGDGRQRARIFAQGYFPVYDPNKSQKPVVKPKPKKVRMYDNSYRRPTLPTDLRLVRKGHPWPSYGQKQHRVPTRDLLRPRQRESR